jgi:aspartyl-tRNA(Asn)/glutamyl-tRNA(Gln) amidotransferase subunit C
MIDKETLENLSRLVRIDIAEEEKDKLMKDMGSILQYVSELKNAPAKENLVSKEHINVTREDIEPHESGKFTQKILENAPQSKDGYFVVKQIMEEKKNK